MQKAFVYDEKEKSAKGKKRLDKPFFLCYNTIEYSYLPEDFALLSRIYSSDVF